MSKRILSTVLGHMWKMPCHDKIWYWIFAAKVGLENLNELSWNANGVEVIRPSTEAQDRL